MVTVETEEVTKRKRKEVEDTNSFTWISIFCPWKTKILGPPFSSQSLENSILLHDDDDDDDDSDS
jgi:hypothetical protein